MTRSGYCSVCDSATTNAISSPRAPKAPISKPDTTTNLPTPPADHRQLGIDQELFTASVYSPGSPLFLPHGTKIFNSLTSFLRSQYELFGFQEVLTPTIYKKSLWEKSGHWENYAEDMYSVVGRGAAGGRTEPTESTTTAKELEIGEDEEYGLKPMNCPGHCLIFASKKRSYRYLPIRYADFSPLHRNEISGALSGLTRVRRFHQDDGHIFCRPVQIQAEILSTLQFIKVAYQALSLGPYRLALSTRPKDHYIGTLEEWDNAEKQLKASLDDSGMDWVIEEGNGAFYGPKIDIILKDSDGKEHQTATIQLDFQLPKRFDLSYQAPAPELEQKGETTTDAELLSIEGAVRPVMIHRAVLGSVERIMALLIEHHNGKWPFWLNPRQVIILTLNDSAPLVKWAQEARDEVARGCIINHLVPLDAPILHVDVDCSPRGLNKKIREAKLKGYAIIAVVGKTEVGAKVLTVEFGSLSKIARATRVMESVELEGDKAVLTATQLRGALTQMKSHMM